MRHNARQLGSAYLTIVDWPVDCPPLQRVRLLVEASGLDPETMLMRVARPTPITIARIEPADAPPVLDTLRRGGVHATAHTGTELSALAEPLRVNDVRDAPSGWELHFKGRHECAVMRFEALFLAVRAAVVKRRAAHPDAAVRPPHADSHVRLSNAEITGLPVSAPRRSATDRHTHVIDLWTRDSACFRIDGDAFAWHILGARRGMSDAVNAQTMIDILSERAPGAIIDSGYERYGCADPSAARFFARGASARTVAPEFEFYSRWAWLFYRSMVGGGPPARSPDKL